MPIYVQCPHCEHPTVLRTAVEGQPYRCRQCNGFFIVQVPQRGDELEPVENQEPESALEQLV